MDTVSNLTVNVLKEFEEIKVIGSDDLGVYFELHDVQYIVAWKNSDELPLICAINYDGDCPHIMPMDIPVRSDKWRNVCLFEAGTVIEYIHTEEEKTRICIQRLIDLTGLSPCNIVNEYQKEFLLYWKRSCSVDGRYGGMRYQLYLDHPEKFQWLGQQVFPKNEVRITRIDRHFNDSDKRIEIATIPALYLPIENAHNLLPPLKSAPWTSKEINDIVNGVTYQRISNEASSEISQLSYSRDSILLVFQLDNMFFGCFIQFKNAGTAKLNIKFESHIKAVFPVDISRCDFRYVNEQIGNEVHEEEVVVVGVGSLGSYVIDELAHAGYQNITIIDDDKYEYANIFRHRSKWFSATNLAKSTMVEFDINHMHPEMNIKAIAAKLTAETISQYIPKDTQFIVFTVGSSDVQLRLNKAFLEQGTQADIYYAWLEHDGKTSHVAVIKETYEGCLECLFTDAEGNLCSNFINRADPGTLVYSRNGCGGTRVHYGNRTLLTASALILKALEDAPMHNKVYSYYEDAVHIQEFPRNKRCNCCGVCK